MPERRGAPRPLPQELATRLLDLLAAATALCLLLPVMLLLGLLILLTDGPPLLYREQRLGRHGKLFPLYKFRTLRPGTAGERSIAPEDDPRITRLGLWLRRWRLDEFPQLVNVLRGDMSLVGPRPPIPNEVDQYHVRQRRRLSMRPGLTCLWQVGGRNQIGFEDWVRLDLEYIDNWSLTLDCQILLRTLPAVLRGTGAS